MSSSWQNFGVVNIVEADDEDGEAGWAVVFHSSDDDSFELDGTHDTPGGALDAAIRWAKQRQLTLSSVSTVVRRQL